MLQRLVPKVERARGKIEGSVLVTGKAKAPVIAGELHAAGEELAVHGLRARSPTYASTCGRAPPSSRRAEGQVRREARCRSTARVPVRGYEVGLARLAHHGARGRVAPADGIAATFDADLEVGLRRKSQAPRGRALPHVTGDVTIGSLQYTRPIR